MKVLLIDWDSTKALDLVRHLGRAGHTIDLLSPAASVAFRSKYCHNAIPYRELTASAMIGQAREIMGEYDVVLPLVDDLVEEVDRCRDLLPLAVRQHLPPPETLQLTFSKITMHELVQRLAVPVPSTIVPQSEQDLQQCAGQWGFPLIIKGEKGSGGTTNRIACTQEELGLFYQQIRAMERGYGGRPFVQEYVPGRVYTVGGLCRDGTLLRVCIHRWDAQFPVASRLVMAVTVAVPALLDYGKRIFESLRWTGIANLEFREDPRTGHFKFLEINPRPWGFIELAHRAGVDMAGDFCRMVRGDHLQPDLGFRTGVRFVRLMPRGLLYLWAYPRALPTMGRWLMRRWCFTGVALDDLRPNLYQFREFVRMLRADLRNGSVRAERVLRRRIESALVAQSTSRRTAIVPEQ